MPQRMDARNDEWKFFPLAADQRGESTADVAITNQCEAQNELYRALLAHRLQHHAFFPLPVEFGVIHLLPRTEIQPSLRNRYDDLVMH